MWLYVRKKGRPKERQPTPPPPHRLRHHQEESAFRAITRLEEEHPGLCVRVSGSPRTGFTLRATNEVTAFTLARIAREKNTIRHQP